MLLTKLYDCALSKAITSSIFDRVQPAASGRRWSRSFAWGLRKWRGLSFRIPHADNFASILYDRGGFLFFHPLTFWASVAIAVFAFTLALRSGPDAACLLISSKRAPYS